MTSGDSTTQPQSAPVTIAAERVRRNAVAAAAITRAVGSMPALYLVILLCGGWMITATWGPFRGFDPYPFPFLMFLDNVLQLVLCLVILVGQRVLSAAADRRAVQTYENAEAIFLQVADLQAHLDHHDRALSRGLSLLDSTPHPWIEQHRVQPPPQAADQAVTRNDRIASWLTRKLGSVWAFYLAGATQIIWIALALLGIQRFDPYPFAFMCFLSTLAQLIFMIIIMVGQDVVGRAADRRSEQTYFDAEAVLHECRRMKDRLVAQDRVIDSLTGYITEQVTEQLARAMHETNERLEHQARAHAVMTTGRVPEDAAVLRTWHELPAPGQVYYRQRARRVGENLAAIGCFMVPGAGPDREVALSDDEVHALARLEYDHWMTERITARATDSPDQLDDAVPLPWADLPDAARIRHLQAARRTPIIVGRAGFQVLRGTPEDTEVR